VIEDFSFPACGDRRESSLTADAAREEIGLDLSE